MTPGFFELATVVLIAAALGVVARILKQPTIIAYLATGALIAALGFFDLGSQESLRLFSELGVMFLLFLVGIEVNYASLRLVGKQSLILGLGQVIFTAAAGFAIAFYGLHMAVLPAVYIAVALTFSSTIIVVKLLSDKHDLQSLYGRLALGTLLVQDAVAVLILLFLSGMGTGQWWSNIVPSPFAPFLALAGGAGLFLVMLWLGRRALPPIFDRLAHYPELLFVVTLAWVFAVSAVVGKLGFSIEIAGLLAGLALGDSAERFQIASRVRSLRDFFLIAFFVLLGTSVALSNIQGLLVPIMAFSLFVIIGNPLVMLILMGLMGYRRRTSFFAGVAVAQISEFSLVLVMLGLKLGHVGAGDVSLVTAVGAITIVVSTYLIAYSEKVFKVFSPILRIFERAQPQHEALPESGEAERPIVLVGYQRTGQSIAAGLPREKLMVVEFDPEMVHLLQRQGIAHIFGDISDEEIFERSGAARAELLISTSPDVSDNLLLLENFANLPAEGSFPAHPKTVFRAETEHEANMLYAAGADYVLLPHFTAGQYLGKTIAIDPAMHILEELRRKDMALLKSIHR